MVTVETPRADLRPSVFLSHSSTDAALAAELCTRLEAQGVRCWIAPRDIVPGRSWADECVRGIEQSSAFILLASANAVSSVEVLSEVEQAHKRRKPLYTVLIGKPKVSKELDYYISRLHWIEFAGDSVDTLANRLAQALNGVRNWTDLASPPSLRRTMRYHRGAFVGSAIATLVVLLLAGLGLYYWMNRQLDLDYRRLAYVTAAAEPGVKDSTINVQARVWLLAAGVPFREVTFLSFAQGPNQMEIQDHSKSLSPEQVGSQELVRFAVPAETERLTTCVGVPSPGFHGRYRVTQTFSFGVGNSISPTAEPKVSKEDGSPCGATS